LPVSTAATLAKLDTMATPGATSSSSLLGENGWWSVISASPAWMRADRSVRAPMRANLVLRPGRGTLPYAPTDGDGRARSPGGPAPPGDAARRRALGARGPHPPGDHRRLPGPRRGGRPPADHAPHRRAGRGVGPLGV